MSDKQPVSITYASLRGRCPSCGKGAFYCGFLTVANSCAVCGLSFSGHEQGDGPAMFCIFIIGSLTGVFAAITEVMFQPSFWLHAAIWIPFVIGSSLFGIRATKAALIAMQYRFRQEDFTPRS